MIVTPAELKQDAIKRQFGPGALCFHILRGQVMLVTSWPWFDGEGDEQEARVMARANPEDPSTNVEVRYFGFMKRVGEQSLEVGNA